jgi:hypothetical protein
MSRLGSDRPARVGSWLLFTIAAAIVCLVPVPSWAVDEFYSRDLFPWVQNGLTFASNLLPIAVLDVLIALATLLVVVRTVLLVRVAWQKGIVTAAWEATRRVIRAVALVVVAFMFTWGCNYRRIPLDTTFGGGGVAPASTDALALAVSDANALAARLRPMQAGEGTESYPQLAAMLEGPMNTALTRLNRARLSRPGRPKSSLVLTPYFTWAGVDGMINPLGLESIVHPDLLPFERGDVLAPEWAHLAGHADEAEASAVGWFACMQGRPALAYSASLYLIMEAAGAMSPEARRKAYAGLDAGVRSDLAAIGERMRKQKPEVQRVATGVYNQYLKANRVADGTASYTRALTLILSSPIRDALNTYRAH